jgi:hypothetical protein
MYFVIRQILKLQGMSTTLYKLTFRYWFYTQMSVFGQDQNQ